ncbi:MAG: hypothetical protein O7D34_11895 [Ignavibacteria bacterium]|nr:hypothetical protein [Ignavibacteria bacterium]
MKRLIFLIFCISSLTTGVAAQVAAIAHKSVPIESITSSKLFEYYSGETRLWDNGQPVVVFDLEPKNAVKDAFYEFMGKSTSRMKSIWMVNMLLGEGDPPESLKSEEEMLTKVASTSGAIGFVSQSTVTEDVKVLAVIGMEKGKSNFLD